MKNDNENRYVDTKPQYTRKPYQRPGLKKLGRFTEPDYELLLSLAKEFLIISSNTLPDKKTRLDLLVRLGLAKSETEEDGRTRYKITEFGKEVLLVRSENKNEE